MQALNEYTVRIEAFPVPGDLFAENILANQTSAYS
jgi:hypothetical protein